MVKLVDKLQNVVWKPDCVIITWSLAPRYWSLHLSDHFLPYDTCLASNESCAQQSPKQPSLP